jgi:hypothetical protein
MLALCFELPFGRGGDGEIVFLNPEQVLQGVAYRPIISRALLQRGAMQLLDQAFRHRLGQLLAEGKDGLRQLFQGRGRLLHAILQLIQLDWCVKVMTAHDRATGNLQARVEEVIRPSIARYDLQMLAIRGCSPSRIQQSKTIWFVAESLRAVAKRQGLTVATYTLRQVR